MSRTSRSTAKSRGGSSFRAALDPLISGEMQGAAILVVVLRLMALAKSLTAASMAAGSGIGFRMERRVAGFGVAAV